VRAGRELQYQAFAALINMLAFDRVIVVDPHSDVVAAVIDRVHVISQREVIGKYDVFNRVLAAAPFVFVSPDAGANKKTADLAKVFWSRDLRASR